MRCAASHRRAEPPCTAPPAPPHLHRPTCTAPPAPPPSLRICGQDALERLHHAVVSLQSDPARDVREAATAAEAEIRQLDLAGLDPDAAHASNAFAAEARARNEDEAARLAEEEDLLRAEQEAVAELKRRAADELAERARAAYSLKVAQGEVGRSRSGDSDHASIHRHRCLWVLDPMGSH